jgi:hypothetical protein
MNVFLQSNKSSALLSVVDGSATKDLYDYKTSATPNPATERVEVQPNGAVQGYSTIATYDVPAYGILDRAILRFRVTLPLKANTTTGYLGINALNYLEIASQNKVITRITRDMLIGKFANMTASESHNAQRYLRFVEKNATGNDALGADFIPAGGIDVFVPLMSRISGAFSTFAEKLDTSFCERLQIRASFGAASTVNTGSVFVESSLITYFTVLPEAESKRLHEVNYSSGPLVMLNSTSFEENSVSIGAADTSATVNIACNGCVTHSVVKVLINTEEDKTKAVELNEITVSGSGRELLKFFGDELEFVTKSSIDRGNGHTEHIYVLDYTVGHHLPGFAGAASFREIAAPSITVTFSAPGAAATMSVVHDQLELI